MHAYAVNTYVYVCVCVCAKGGRSVHVSVSAGLHSLLAQLVPRAEYRALYVKPMSCMDVYHVCGGRMESRDCHGT